MVKNKVIRGLLIGAGTLFLGFGILGIVLPLLPTTPFLLLAAWCYAKSSKKYYFWLINNKWFGKYIRNYQEGRGIPIKVKVIAISFLWLTILFAAFIIISSLLVRIILIGIAIGVTIHILTIPTFKSTNRVDKKVETLDSKKSVPTTVDNGKV